MTVPKKHKMLPKGSPEPNKIEREGSYDKGATGTSRPQRLKPALQTDTNNLSTPGERKARKLQVILQQRSGVWIVLLTP